MQAASRRLADVTTPPDPISARASSTACMGTTVTPTRPPTERSRDLVHDSLPERTGEDESAPSGRVGADFGAGSSRRCADISALV